MQDNYAYNYYRSHTVTILGLSNNGVRFDLWLPSKVNPMPYGFQAVSL